MPNLKFALRLKHHQVNELIRGLEERFQYLPARIHRPCLGYHLRVRLVVLASRNLQSI